MATICLSNRLLYARSLGRHEERDHTLCDHVDRLIFRLADRHINKKLMAETIAIIASAAPEEASILHTMSLIERDLGLPMHPKTKAAYDRIKAYGEELRRQRERAA
jgi:hypothetical protein